MLSIPPDWRGLGLRLDVSDLLQKFKRIWRNTYERLMTKASNMSSNFTGDGKETRVGH